MCSGKRYPVSPLSCFFEALVHLAHVVALSGAPAPRRLGHLRDDDDQVTGPSAAVHLYAWRELAQRVLVELVSQLEDLWGIAGGIPEGSQ